MVDGDMYKAVMQKEKSCTELEKSEVVTIRLFEQDRSILLRSFTEENGKVDLRLILLSFCFVIFTSLSPSPNSPKVKSKLRTQNLDLGFS